MTPIEIIVIIICVVIVLSNIIVAIIRKKKGKRSCGFCCSNCPYANGCHKNVNDKMDKK